MTTQKQIEANQNNALLGGVKTEEGKKTSRLNAKKHGFFSKILTVEDKELNQDFCDDIYAVFDPSNAYEEQLLEIMLSNLLVYRRISIVESELLSRALNKSATNLGLNSSPYDLKLENNVGDEILKFQRYKVASLNAVLKIQLNLERLTRMRKGESIPPPQVADVNVTGANLGSF